tara:strand:+ start:427 stop:822 length:396 start_codon:yes stop_codon:yes gene_type:complete
MKTTQREEHFPDSVLKMTHKILTDSSFQALLAKKAVIYSPTSACYDGCLWLTGTGVFSSERSMFVSLAQEDFDQISISLTLTDDDTGSTNQLLWGYGDLENKPIITQMLLILIQDLIDGGGERVSVEMRES